MQSLLGKTYMAHSATEDVLAMQELVNSVQLDETVIKKNVIYFTESNSVI